MGVRGFLVYLNAERISDRLLRDHQRNLKTLKGASRNLKPFRVSCFMGYSDLLLDQRWQKRRYDILVRDNFRCRFCGEEDKGLQIHHIIYESKFPWETSDRYLITLCPKCHKEEESMKDFDYYSLLSTSGITRQQFAKICMEIDKYFKRIDWQDVDSFDDFIKHINHG